MDITKKAEQIIRDLWNPHVPDRNKNEIGSKISTELNLHMASVITGMRMGIALGEASTPEDAIERLQKV